MLEWVQPREGGLPVLHSHGRTWGSLTKLISLPTLLLLQGTRDRLLGLWVRNCSVVTTHLWLPHRGAWTHPGLCHCKVPVICCPPAHRGTIPDLLQAQPRPQSLNILLKYPGTMQMVMDTLLEPPNRRNCTRSYKNLRIAVIDFSSTASETDSSVLQRGENCFCNATGQEGLYKN